MSGWSYEQARYESGDDWQVWENKGAEKFSDCVLHWTNCGALGKVSNRQGHFLSLFSYLTFSLFLNSLSPSGCLPFSVLFSFSLFLSLSLFTFDEVIGLGEPRFFLVFLFGILIYKGFARSCYRPSCKAEQTINGNQLNNESTVWSKSGERFFKNKQLPT